MKLVKGKGEKHRIVSPPMRGRGLKPFPSTTWIRIYPPVAPHAGAWIETLKEVA